MFQWNVGAERYRADNGRFVSRAAVRATLDIVLDAQIQRARALSERLVAGNVLLDAWRSGMSQALKTAHLEGAAVARGGWAQLTQADLEWTGQRISSQLGYLEAFRTSLANGLAPMDGTVAARSAMYVEAGRGTQREMERRMAVSRGRQLEKNVLAGSRDPCSQCPALSALGYVRIGTLPPVGSRQCLSRCKCYLIFKDDLQPQGSAI